MEGMVMINYDFEVRRVKLSDIKKAEYNPREISEDAFSGLGNSIERFGLLSLIVWNKRSGNIVGGHQRYSYLIERGETETDVVVVDLNDKEEIALNITLNNPRMRGDYSEDAIEILKKVEESDPEGFGDLGLENLLNFLKRIGGKQESKGNKGKEEDENIFKGELVPVVRCPRCGCFKRKGE